MSSRNQLFELIKWNYPKQLPIDYYAKKLHLSKEDVTRQLHELVHLQFPLDLTTDLVSLTIPMISYSKIQSFFWEKGLTYSPLFFSTIQSTNSKALDGLADYSDRTVLLTDYQYKGKGRLGRDWHSPIGTAVTLSVILKPDLSGEQAVLFTQLSAAALVKTLQPFVSAKIKWPNDIIVNNKKIAGILTETSFNGSTLEGVVVGIGINTALSREDLPDSLLDKATSLLIEKGNSIDPNQLIADFLSYFESYYHNWQLTKDSTPFIQVCKRSSLLIDKEIFVRTGESARLAYVRDINASGELLVEYTDDGTVMPLRTLDFSIRGIDSYI